MRHLAILWCWNGCTALDWHLNRRKASEMEIHGNQWKSVEIHANRQKSSEINQWKSMEIDGNHWKSMEIGGNRWKSTSFNERERRTSEARPVFLYLHHKLLVHHFSTVFLLHLLVRNTLGSHIYKYLDVKVFYFLYDSPILREHPKMMQI